MCKLQGQYSTVFRNFDWDQNSEPCSTTPVKRKFITGYILRAKNIIKTSRALVFGSYNFWLYVCSNVRGKLLSSLFKTLFPAFFTQRYYEVSNEPPYITSVAHYQKKFLSAESAKSSHILSHILVTVKSSHNFVTVFAYIHIYNSFLSYT